MQNVGSYVNGWPVWVKVAVGLFLLVALIRLWPPVGWIAAAIVVVLWLVNVSKSTGATPQGGGTGGLM